VSNCGNVLKLLNSYRVLFWDFDGVIKESVEIKTHAYVQLFESFGGEITDRVRAHHQCNGGLSRFSKIPIYLRWAGLEPTEARLRAYCNRFAAAVCQRVLECDWVPGAREYLTANHIKQHFVLISATPQDELKGITDALGLSLLFREIHGAPESKGAVVRSVLQRESFTAGTALVIGDSAADYEAARAAGVDFLLRRTPLNQTLQQRYSGPQCEDFRNG
jgi:phosphoglycolate phosphatase-like HAD superfamily hydrolase